MKARLLWSLLAAALCAGCRTPQPQVWPGASVDLRSELGAVEVRVAEDSRHFAFDMPSTKTEAVRDMAGAAMSGNLYAAGRADNAGPLILMALPVAAAGGALYGAVSGIRKDEFREALAVVTNTTAENDLVSHLPGLVRAKAKELGFSALDASQDSRPFEHVVTLRVMNQQLIRARGTPNSPLKLHVLVSAWVSDASGKEVYATYVDRKSRPRAFLEWSENGGRRLRRECRRMQEEVATTIVQRVFLGESSE